MQTAWSTCSAPVSYFQLHSVWMIRRSCGSWLVFGFCHVAQQRGLSTFSCPCGNSTWRLVAEQCKLALFHRP